MKAIHGSSTVDLRRRAFAEHAAAGRSGVEAARLAGYTGSPQVLAVAAARLLRNAKVQKIIRSLAEKASNGRILTAQERREWLSRLITQAAEPVEVRDRIAAIRELNAMDGLHIKRLEHAGSAGQPLGAVLAAIPTEVIRERLAELAKRRHQTGA
ncbi:MAG TPA: hypothetical protein DCS97_00240 [Planctomycetes bacterium]|nr:hypothetical protein [Planctomycetota bacterium]